MLQFLEEKMVKILMDIIDFRSVDVLMETKGGKKKSSSSSGSKQYEAPLGYIIEDVRPNGGIEKFRSAAYSNVRSLFSIPLPTSPDIHLFFLIISWVIFVCSA
ncbi:hypothetical protein I3843_15G140600 [Carya illinoinensis]|nr:hypothetical protein I3760_15G145000 [Carya illinoinensis]KAG7945203.1 hypothetical protein I3843_15G140600 [Carya illinoinensis]